MTGPVAPGPDGRLRREPAAGDVLRLRAPHVCGADRVVVTLVGLDVRLRCAGCGAGFTLTRERLRSRVTAILGSLGDFPELGR